MDWGKSPGEHRKSSNPESQAGDDLAEETLDYRDDFLPTTIF
jgi:hypothetical protein